MRTDFYGAALVPIFDSDQFEKHTDKLAYHHAGFELYLKKETGKMFLYNTISKHLYMVNSNKRPCECNESDFGLMLVEYLIEYPQDQILLLSP